jgi:DNA polymerase
MAQNRTDTEMELPVRGVRQMLESLARAGVTSLPRPIVAPGVTGAERSEAPAERPTIVSAPQVATSGSSAGASLCSAPATLLRDDARGMPAADRSAALQVIAQEVAGCTRCAELAASRTRTVFGVGNPRARLVFMGEAPGADEDRQGIPFVGAAGQLLTKIIENGLKMRRDDVYILNILKCRPPGNRQPSPEEAANCRGFLDRQLDIIRPEFICCLGATAAQNLLGTSQSIGRMRGRTYDYRGSRVIVTYHPAYLLRSPGAKKDVWEDMKLLLREMGLPAPN